MLQEQLNRQENMTDEQLWAQINMMKANKELARQQFNNRPGAPPMDDAQLDMVLNMMTPDMMRMSMKMAKENPNLLNQARGMGPQAPPQQPNTQRQTNTEEAKTSGPTQAPPQMPGGFDPNNMEEMMNNPMVKEMMNNPEMMKQAMNMMGGGGA